MSIFYGASFLVIGLFLPYFPVWLDWRGLTAGQISLIVALPSFARIIGTPVASVLADRIGDPRQMVQFLASCTLLCFLLLPLAGSAPAILALIALYGLTGPALLPLAEAIALAGVRAGGLDYGRMRLWGSVTFILASAVGGFALSSYGPEAIQWLLIGAVALTFAASWLLPVVEGANSSSTWSRPSFADALSLIGTSGFALFLVATALMQSSHALLYAFGTLHWRASGISEFTIGLLWSVGVVAEILLFAFARGPLARLGALGLIIVGGTASALRWAGTAMDPPLAVLFVLQALHGLSFGAAHLGAVHYMSAHIPPRLSATAQGLYATTSAGIAMGTVLLVSGPLYEVFGANAFWGMAALALAGLVASLGLARR